MKNTNLKLFDFYCAAVHTWVIRYLEFIEGTGFSFNVLFPFDFLLNSKGRINVKSLNKFVDFIKRFKSVAKGKVFLDCGAFSAWRKGFSIDLGLYIEFVKEFGFLFDVVAALDVIKDGEKTWYNFLEMKKSGLDNILPVYHPGEPESVLLRLVDSTDYVGMGGAFEYSSDVCIKIYRSLLFKDNGDLKFPNTKFHGFGTGSPVFFQIYPWYSCDASSVAINARYGKLWCIRNLNGVLDIKRFFVSSRQKGNKDHYCNLQNYDKEFVDSLLERYGCKICDFDDDLYEDKTLPSFMRFAFNLRVFQDEVVFGSFKLLDSLPKML